MSRTGWSRSAQSIIGKADAGAFTPEQVRHYKRDTAERAPEVKGRFDWLRHKIVLASGGVFYIDNVYDLAIGGQPAVWFTRDEEGYALAQRPHAAERAVQARRN